MRFFKIMLLLPLVVFVGAVVGGSGILNYLFGSGFGTTEFDRELLGTLSAAIDGFKSMLPVLGGIAVAYGARGLWSASWAMWAVCAVLSLVSTFGFVVQSRQDTAAVKSAGVERRAELSEDRASIKRQTSKLKSRPYAVVDADYKARCYSKKRKRWRSCKNLMRERGRALAIKEGRIMTSALDSAKSQISVRAGGDQQVNVISSMIAKPPFAVMVGIAVLFSIILEVVTGFGPAMLYAAFQHVLIGEKAAAVSFKLPGFLSRWMKREKHDGGSVEKRSFSFAAPPTETVVSVEDAPNEGRGFIRSLLKSPVLVDGNPAPVSTVRAQPSFDGAKIEGEIKAFVGENISIEAGVLTGVDAYASYQNWCDARGAVGTSFMAFHGAFSSLIAKNFPGVAITRDPRGRRFGDKLRYDGLALVSLVRT